MRLSRLLIARKEAILQDFEDFARSHTASGEHMDVRALRDHAAGMLEAFALDLEQPQSAAEQHQKSHGDAPRAQGAAATAAEMHGADRAGSGFSLAEMFAEYRALRASVIRHWLVERDGDRDPDIEDLTRFNEAVDQAVAESITRYASAVSAYREMFLAILGHDLRTPINAVLAASSFLAENSALPERDVRLARTIQRSVRRMEEMVEQMLDFTATQLGRGIPLRPAPADLSAVLRDAVEEIRMTDPDCQVGLETRGDLRGEWDEGRIRQAIANLLDNAVRHARDGAVKIHARADESDREIVVAVHNHGAPISARERVRIFEPFQRASSEENGNSRSDNGLGLGLYIAREIVAAHGGRIEVASSDGDGTTFSIHLPREHATGAVRQPQPSA